MYQRNSYYNYPTGNQYYNNDDRLVGGGFLGPFLLGGLTGGLVSPYFYPRPIYPPFPPRPYPPRPYPPRPYPPRW